MMNRGCLLPRSVGRQLAGTVREQLAHLTCDVARMTAAAAISGDGFQGADKLVLAVLQVSKESLRPRQIEERTRVSKTGVNESLQRLERCGKARRKAVPSPTRTPAWAWSAV